MPQKPLNAVACPCDTGQPYARCCAPWHQGAAAPTPEALMRSRYSAYAFALKDYLLATWHSSTRPSDLDLSVHTRWLGLSIKAAPAPVAEVGWVRFVARYREGGARAERLEELSRFCREDGRWYYLGSVDINGIAAAEDSFGAVQGGEGAQ